MPKYDFIDGERIRRARSVKEIHPVVQDIAINLRDVAALRYIKLFPERLAASNVLSSDGKKNPVVKIGADDMVGVELLIDTSNQIVQFHALTSAEKGCGRQIVEAVVNAAPDDWFLPVLMDWSGGFWERMADEYPRLSLA